MTREEVIKRLKESKRSEVAKGTGLPYMYLYRLERGIIKDPGTERMDVLRAYLLSQQIKLAHPPS